jgi:hypothetical protein
MTLTSDADAARSIGSGDVCRVDVARSLGHSRAPTRSKRITVITWPDPSRSRASQTGDQLGLIADESPRLADDKQSDSRGCQLGKDASERKP